MYSVRSVCVCVSRTIRPLVLSTALTLCFSNRHSSHPPISHHLTLSHVHFGIAAIYSDLTCHSLVSLSLTAAGRRTDVVISRAVSLWRQQWLSPPHPRHWQQRRCSGVRLLRPPSCHVSCSICSGRRCLCCLLSRLTRLQHRARPRCLLPSFHSLAVC